MPNKIERQQERDRKLVEILEVVTQLQKLITDRLPVPKKKKVKSEQ